MYLSIGSSSPILPCSHNFKTPIDVIAFVIEAILKISSVLYFSFVSGFFIPYAFSKIISFSLPTSTTAPGILFSLISSDIKSSIFFSFSKLRFDVFGSTHPINCRVKNINRQYIFFISLNIIKIFSRRFFVLTIKSIIREL